MTKKNAYAYGVHAAMRKFGMEDQAASSDGGLGDAPHGGWFGEPGTDPHGRDETIDDAFRVNEMQYWTSPMETPPAINATLGATGTNTERSFDPATSTDTMGGKIGYYKGAAAAASNFNIEGIHGPKSTPTPKGTPHPLPVTPQPPSDQNVLTGLTAQGLQSNTMARVEKFMNPLTKASEFNFGLHGKPHVADAISADNGRSVLGTNFQEPWKRTGHSREVHTAFNDLNSQKNVDFLNEAGQGVIGAAP